MVPALAEQHGTDLVAQIEHGRGEALGLGVARHGGAVKVAP